MKKAADEREAKHGKDKEIEKYILALYFVLCALCIANYVKEDVMKMFCFVYILG